MTAHYDTREFERMVNADVRDRRGVGEFHYVLRHVHHRARWLTVLISIRASIESQHAQDRALLLAHPGRGGGDAPPTKEYLEYRAELAGPRSRRERALRAVSERITEAQTLIGCTFLTPPIGGAVVSNLLEIDRLLAGGDVADARAKIASAVRWLDQEVCA